jgi:CheY-like chemotaxis protein
MTSMKKILFIEDDASFLEIITSILKKADFEVHTASDGEEGLRMVRENKPDLILLDLILPKMDGFVFMKTMRGSDDIPWIPVIAFSSQVAEHIQEEAIAVGCQAFMSKNDVNLHSLTEKVSEFITD